MATFLPPQPPPAYLVVIRHSIVAADIVATIAELDPNATVVVALTLPEAADRLPGLDRIVLAIIEGAPQLLDAAPFRQALADRGARILVLDDPTEESGSWPDIAVLGLPFSTNSLLAALRQALG